MYGVIADLLISIQKENLNKDNCPMTLFCLSCLLIISLLKWQTWAVRYFRVHIKPHCPKCPWSLLPGLRQALRDLMGASGRGRVNRVMLCEWKGVQRLSDMFINQSLARESRKNIEHQIIAYQKSVNNQEWEEKETALPGEWNGARQRGRDRWQRRESHNSWERVWRETHR